MEAFLHRVPLGQRGGYAGAARAAAAGAGAPSRAFDPAQVFQELQEERKVAAAESETRQMQDAFES